MTQQSQFQDSLPVAEASAGNGRAAAGAPGPDSRSVVSNSPDSGSEATTLKAGREDLTVFFAIGVVVDVLLVAAFLIWAVGQWRKTKK